MESIIAAIKYGRSHGKVQCVFEWTFFKMVKENLWNYEDMSLSAIQTLFVFMTECIMHEKDELEVVKVSQVYLYSICTHVCVIIRSINCQSNKVILIWMMKEMLSHVSRCPCFL